MLNGGNFTSTAFDRHLRTASLFPHLQLVSIIRGLLDMPSFFLSISPLVDHQLNMSSELTCNLLGLPLEIREYIYAAVLSTSENRKQLDGDRCVFAFDLRLYRVCKQIYHEARDVFRRLNIFVCIETPFPDAQHSVVELGRVPMVADGKPAEGFQPCQMRCVIDAPEMIGGHGSKFIIALDDLETFCTMWYYFDLSHTELNSHLGLSLTIAENPNDERDQQLPKSIQTSLLLPWGRVKNLDHFHIHGPHNKELAEDLRKTMNTPYVSPARCVEEATSLKDEGNQALKAGNILRALELYRTSFMAIHIVISGRRRNVWGDSFFETYIREGRLKGQWAGLVRTTLRIQLVANSMLAYLKLEEYDEAYFWGMRSINLMRESFQEAADQPRLGFPGADSWGKIYYRTAIAAKALGEMGEAREMLRIAAAWLPNDHVVKADLAEWGSLRLG